MMTTSNWMRRMKRLLGRCVMVIALCPVIVAPSYGDPPGEILVSAAISLKSAFDEIGKQYESYCGQKVVFNYGASGDLAKQLVGGAPVDVFASAATQDMREVWKRALIDTTTVADIAYNRIVLIAPARAKTSLTSFEGLKADEIRRIAVGNPKTVPAGRYAEEVFSTVGVLPFIREKLIYTENVRQALDYVVRGEVDAGVVYATDAAARPKEIVIIVTASESSHRRVVYTAAVVSGTKNPAASKAFIAFVLSRGGVNILRKFGFKTGP